MKYCPQFSCPYIKLNHLGDGSMNYFIIEEDTASTLLKCFPPEIHITCAWVFAVFVLFVCFVVLPFGQNLKQCNLIFS